MKWRWGAEILWQMCTATCSANRRKSEDGVWAGPFLAYHFSSLGLVSAVSELPRSSQHFNKRVEDFLLPSFSRRKLCVCCVYSVRVVDSFKLLQTCEESVSCQSFQKRLCVTFLPHPCLLRLLCPWLWWAGCIHHIGHCAQIFGQEWFWMFLWECLWEWDLHLKLVNFE